MLGDLKLIGILALALLAVVTAAAQTGPVVLKSPNGALEISMTAWPSATWFPNNRI